MGNMMMFSYFFPRMIVFRFKKPCRHGKEGYAVFVFPWISDKNYKIKGKKTLLARSKYFFSI